MASNGVVAEVTTTLTKAVKAKDTSERTPAQWATLAGYKGSEASALRRLIARVSDNGCGRNARYRKMTASALLELIELGETFVKAEPQKQGPMHNRIHGKLYPAARKGAKQAKTGAKRTRKTTA